MQELTDVDTLNESEEDAASLVDAMVCTGEDGWSTRLTVSSDLIKIMKNFNRLKAP